MRETHHKTSLWISRDVYVALKRRAIDERTTLADELIKGALMLLATPIERQNAA